MKSHPRLGGPADRISSPGHVTQFPVRDIFHPEGRDRALPELAWPAWPGEGRVPAVTQAGGHARATWRLLPCPPPTRAPHPVHRARQVGCQCGLSLRPVDLGRCCCWALTEALGQSQTPAGTGFSRDRDHTPDGEEGQTRHRVQKRRTQGPCPSRSCATLGQLGTSLSILVPTGDKESRLLAKGHRGPSLGGSWKTASLPRPPGWVARLGGHTPRTVPKSKRARPGHRVRAGREHSPESSCLETRSEATSGEKQQGIELFSPRIKSVL